MEFTYLVDNKPLLKKIKLDFSRSRLIVVAGVENNAFEIMGGVIAGLFPIKKEETFSQLEEIVKYFSGALVVHNGEMPKSGLYIGADPDRHILFSKVREEIFAQLGFDIDPYEVIKRFGLKPSFLKRKIMTLSGGEKVKVALSIIFNKKADCIVLHGVLPWLDVNGKMILLDEIRRSLKKGVKILVLEQEVENFKDLDADFYYFDGFTISKSGLYDIRKRKKNLLKLVAGIKSGINMSKSDSINSDDNLLTFKNVYFDYISKKGNSLLLNGVDFTLSNSRIYGLTGENGSGKSTIAKLITRILMPVEGKILLEDRDIKAINRQELIKRICYVSQFPERQLVYGDVEQYRHKAVDTGNGLSIELFNSFFDKNKSYPISTLTPLQLKMLLLFSSINMETRLLILDEPTWGVDIEGQIEIGRIIDFLIKRMERLSILLISHDHEFLDEFSTDTLILSNGKIHRLN